MALKYLLESLEGLADGVKAEYKKGEDGKFYLDVQGVDDHPDVGALKRAKQHEVKARNEAEAKLKELTEKLTTMTEERDGILRGAIPKNDVEKLESSWKEKLSKREKELQDSIDQLTGQLSETLVDSVARDMATKISKAPDLILPHIKNRLKMDTENGKAVTRVLDKDGKVSALTVEELKKEIVANPAYSSVIIGSKATGGGAGGGQGGSGAPQALDFTKASPKEIAAHIKATKEAGGS